MSKYYYDLHTHSCLSPCASNDNTPCDLLGMASICGINILALTDHNTCKNCPAFFKAAKQYGIIPVAGMELTTAEDVHIICLFETLEDGMNFDAEIQNHRIFIENRMDIFGEQLILDESDNVIGEEMHLLSNATDLSIEDVPNLVEKFNGVCYPAHIDRLYNGIISVLGTFPQTPHFSAFEIRDLKNKEEYTERYSLSDKICVVSSDAHYLTDIKDAENFFEIDDEPYSSALVRKRLISLLRGDIK